MAEGVSEIEIWPAEDEAVMKVLEDLDQYDRLEAVLYRGDDAAPLAMFADWRAANACRSASRVAYVRRGPVRIPFAILGVTHAGTGGVAQAALLARHHDLYRWPLARLAVRLRLILPGYAQVQGIHRLEVRSWAQHPTAARLLRAIGFAWEAELAGYAGGAARFHQFAWIREESAHVHIRQKQGTRGGAAAYTEY